MCSKVGRQRGRVPLQDQEAPVLASKQKEGPRAKDFLTEGLARSGQAWCAYGRSPGRNVRRRAGD